MQQPFELKWLYMKKYKTEAVTAETLHANNRSPIARYFMCLTFLLEYQKRDDQQEAQPTRRQSG